jgi:hypothetical protein
MEGARRWEEQKKDQEEPAKGKIMAGTLSFTKKKE